MIRQAKLYARVNQNGVFKRIPVEFSGKNGKAIQPTGAVSYAVRVAGVFEPAGKDLSLALTFLRQRQAQIGDGIKVSELTPIDRPRASQGHENVSGSISEAADQFIADLKQDVADGKKAKATLLAYGNSIDDFRNYCGVVHFSEITASVLKNHERWIRKNIQKRVSGHIENTIANRFRYLNVFLRANGIKLAKDANPKPDDPGLLSRKDVPKEKSIVNEQKAHGTRTYTVDDINAMLNAANVDEQDLIHFALKTGFRDEEIQNAEWADIDWDGKLRQEPNQKPIPNIITGPKSPSQFIPNGFQTKNRKLRQVEIPTLISRLKHRQARLKKAGNGSTLIFPNGGGRANTHLVRIVQLVAKRAADAGRKITGSIGLHRFRKTYATMMLAATDIYTVKELLGHEDIETTERYLGVDRSKAAKGAIRAFKDFD